MQKYRFWSFFLLIILYSILYFLPPRVAARNQHGRCYDYQVVFARGSGEELHTNIDHLSFRQAIANTFSYIPNKSYHYYQLGESNLYGRPYPAIGTEKPTIITGAIISGGQAFQFGESVKTGIQELTTLYKQVSKSCPNTHFIFGGYSQGAMVINQSIRNFDYRKITYSASFGDPKLYLPEGSGFFPKACSGNNFSSYRQNVPDCHVEKGILNGLKPYIYDDFKGRIGAWCNAADFICGSTFDPLGLTNPEPHEATDFFSNIFHGHVSYSKFGAYKEAGEIIYQKITKDPWIIPRQSKITHYYNPLDILFSSNFFKKHQTPADQPPVKPSKHQETDLIIVIPNLLDDYTSRYYEILYQILKSVREQHASPYFYTYGHFLDNEYNPRYFTKQPNPSLPKGYTQGVTSTMNIYYPTIEPGVWQDAIHAVLTTGHRMPDVDIPNLVASTFYDVVKMHDWSKNSNHLLFFITPHQDYHQSQTLSSEIIQRVDQQNKRLSLSTFFLNENSLLTPVLTQFKTVSPQNIFDTYIDYDQLDYKLFYQNYPELASRTIQPKFDFIDLSFTNGSFSVTESSEKKRQAQKRKFKNAKTTKYYYWKVTKGNKHINFRTHDNHLHIPISSLSPIQMIATTPDTFSHHTTINFLPSAFPYSYSPQEQASSTYQMSSPQEYVATKERPSKQSLSLSLSRSFAQSPSISLSHSPHQNQDTTPNQSSIQQQIESTAFPYRALIIDNFFAGFTDQKHLTFSDLDKAKSHQITLIKYSALGRQIKQEEHHIPAKITPSNPTNPLSPISPQDSSTPIHHPKQTDQLPPFSPNPHHTPKVPDCGVGPDPKKHQKT